MKLLKQFLDGLLRRKCFIHVKYRTRFLLIVCTLLVILLRLKITGLRKTIEEIGKRKNIEVAFNPGLKRSFGDRLPVTLTGSHKRHQEDCAKGNDYNRILSPILDHIQDGFFVECGAFDGITGSNTLYYERRFNWTGILIEPDPESFSELVANHRKALALNACLSPENRTANVTFSHGNSRACNTLIPHKRRKFGLKIKSFTARCLTFDDVLRSYGVRKVDFLSLDVEGAELAILSHVPFHRVDIRVILAEYHTWDLKVALMKLLSDAGYYVYADFLTNRVYGDLAFAKAADIPINAKTRVVHNGKVIQFLDRYQFHNE